MAPNTRRTGSAWCVGAFCRPHTRFDLDITVLVEHVQSSEAFGQMCSKATLFQCGSARSHALKQGTWGPCLTRTVLATAVEEEREVAVESQ